MEREKSGKFTNDCRIPDLLLNSVCDGFDFFRITQIAFIVFHQRIYPRQQRQSSSNRPTPSSLTLLIFQLLNVQHHHSDPSTHQILRHQPPKSRLRRASSDKHNLPRPIVSGVFDPVVTCPEGEVPVDMVYTPQRDEDLGDMSFRGRGCYEEGFEGVEKSRGGGGLEERCEG